MRLSKLTKIFPACSAGKILDKNLLINYLIVIYFSGTSTFVISM